MASWVTLKFLILNTFMTLFLLNNNNNNNNNIFYYSVTHQIYIRPDNIYIYTVIKESDARPILTYETL